MGHQVNMRKQYMIHSTYVPDSNGNSKKLLLHEDNCVKWHFSRQARNPHG